MGRGGGAGAGGLREGAGVPGQAQVREPLDRERAADPVRVAGRRRRPARPAWSRGRSRPSAPPAPRGTSARSAGWPTRPPPGPRSGWPAPATGGGDASSPLGPSVFLEEVRAACEAGAGTVACWAAPPDEDAENPALAEPPSATWPAEPQGRQQEAVREAAELEGAALDAVAPYRPRTTR